MEAPITGIDRFLMFRLFEEKSERNATKLALQTTHTIKEEAKADSEATKDGSIASSGALETTVEIEAIATDTDVNDMLHYAVKNKKKVEVWEIDISKPKNQDGKYFSQYGVGYLSSWETPADAEKNTTIKTTLTVDDKLVAGYATLSEEQEETAKAFFRDTITDPKDEEPIPDYVPESKRIPVDSVSLTPATVSVEVGATKALIAKILPTDATDQSVTYKSSDDSVATISDAGVVTGVKAGTADVTATASDKEATTKVTVTAGA